MGVELMSQCRKRNSKGSEISKPYEPTPRERDAIEAWRNDLRSPRLKVSREEDKVTAISFDHQDPRTGQAVLMQALGTTDTDFLSGILHQLSDVPREGPDLEDKLNFMLAIVRGLKPKDQLETMLGAQMAAVHLATMTLAHRLGRVETIQQQDSAERAFNKLARTFAAQMEALKRYRAGGQQKVTVEHVTVNEGGQAIVGSVTQGGLGDQKNKGSTS
jgi:hypothetical protein